MADQSIWARLSGVELLLEPLAFPPAKIYQQELYTAGIPITSFETDDLEAEVTRLKALEVVFTTEPQDMGHFKMAVFDDSCGNLVCLTQSNAE